MCDKYHVASLLCFIGGRGAGGWEVDASFGFYLREAFQGQTNTEKILYNNESLGADML